MDTATSASPAPVPHDQQTRDLAYQLWAFAAGRQVSRVAALLASPEHNQPVPERTLRDWVTRYRWAERAAEDVARIAPDLRYQAFSELLFAGLDGARYIRRVNAGEEHPDKVRAQLAIAAVDRIGFSPVGKGDPTAAITPPAETRAIAPADLTGLTPDQLAALEAEYRSSRRSRT